jgi:predicted GNAT family N-acyltransferase
MTFKLVDYLSPQYLETVELRREVLRKPLGLDFSRDELEDDFYGLHVAAYDGRDLIGCLILSPLKGDEIKMRQVAVEPAWQGKGVGKGMARWAEECAVENGYSEVVVHARENVVPFYEGLGYSVEGEPFEEVGIPHRRMKRVLS